MASSKDNITKEGGKASLESVKASAEKLKAVQDNISSASVVNIPDTPKQAGVFQSKAATPNPAAPMDHAVLENIGIVGAGQNIVNSSVASVSALSNATKQAAHKSILPKDINTSEGAPSTVPASASGIQVNSDYKPAFQSQDRATLAASMDKPKTSAIGTSATPSLQSRLQSEQGNLYRAAAGKPLQNNQPLGGGFRMSTDPNAAGSSASAEGAVSSPADNRAQYNAGGQSSNTQDNGAQIVHHHEDVKGKSGIGAGALGMLGLLLIGGGGAAVVMKPELLSTTGITGSKTAAVQSISAPDALIPRVSEVYEKPAPIAQAPAPVQNQRVAAVAVMTPPAQPSAPAARKITVSASTERFSETGKDVPLNLNIAALKVKTDQYIRIGGMPDDATLSSGVDMGDGNWLVAPDAIKTITFTAPEGHKGVIELYMQKIKDDARSAVGTPKTFKVYVGEKPKQIMAAAPQVQQPLIQQPVIQQPIQASEPKVAAYNPALVQPAPAAKPQAAPAPIRAQRQIPILPEGISEANEGDGFGALPTTKTSRYKRPTARKRAIAPARAPRNLRESLPVGRTFSKENYGDTAQPIQQQRVASASPVRSIPQVSPQRAKTLLKRGNNLYRLGDLISARALYGQIAAGGNAEAALAMGRTYDPIYFEKLGVQGFQPEPNLALEWYKKAKSAGLAKAQGKIDNLNYYLNQ